MNDTEIQCGICGKSFEPHNPAQKYCSPACAMEQERRRKKANYHRYHQDQTRPHICAICGASFRASTRAKYCSEECRQAGRNQKEWNFSPKVCRVCETVFTPNHSRQIFCSDECRQSYHERYREEYKRISFRGTAKPEPPKKPVILSSKPVQTVTEIAREAAEHGMTYGKYLAWRKQNEGA